MASPLERVLSGLLLASLGNAPPQPHSPRSAESSADATRFWDALKHGANVPAAANCGGPPTNRLPRLQRAKSVGNTLSPDAEGNLPAMSNSGARAAARLPLAPPVRGTSGTFTTALPPLPPCTAAGGRAMPRTTSMVCIPSKHTDSSLSSSPLSRSPGAAGSLGAYRCTAAASTSPVAQLCQGIAGLGFNEYRPGSDGHSLSGVPSPSLVQPADGGGEEAQALRGSLSARCTTAAQSWKGLEDFTSLRLIASGRHATVWEAAPNAAGPGGQPQHSVVLKGFGTTQLGCRALQRLLLEQRLLQTTVPHPHVIRGLGSFSENAHLFLVMEHADGRTVQQFITHWKRRNQEDFEGCSETTVVPEVDAASLVVAPLLDALAHLHGQGIIHRDVKAANAVFSGAACIKLIDFSLSVDLKDVQRGPLYCQVGTPGYMAPELFSDHPPPAAQLDRTDVWSLGVLAFQMLAGQLPWWHEVPAVLQDMVLQAAPPFQLLDAMGATPAAKDFIQQAMARDPLERPTAAQLRAHPWLLRHAGGQTLQPAQFAA